MEHHCHAVGCSQSVPPKMHMCPKHWYMVPADVRSLIWKHYRPGQEIDKQPSIDYIATAFVSISCVALKEGKPLPTLWSANAEDPQPANDRSEERQNKEHS